MIVLPSIEYGDGEAGQEQPSERREKRETAKAKTDLKCEGSFIVAIAKEQHLIGAKIAGSQSLRLGR